MPRPKHLVQRNNEQCEELSRLMRTGNAPARTQSHARILLKADCPAHGSACDDATIAVACAVSRPTIERVRRAFATQDLNAALHRTSWTGSSRRKLDG